MTPLFLTVWIGLCLIAAAQQFAAWRLLKPQQAVGDEKAYLAHGEQQDPYKPRMFLRVPLMHWLARRCYLMGCPSTCLRGVMAVSGIVTCGAAFWSAGLAGGLTGMFVCGGVLLCLFERVVFNQHMWPDPLLACFLAIIQLLLLTVEDAVLCGSLCGILVALSALTRLEQLALAPGVFLAILARGASPSLLLLACVAGPAAISYLLWTLHNGLRYGIWLPDNTWLFNLKVMSSEVEATQHGQTVQQLVQDVAKDWKQQSTRPSAGLFNTLLRSPFTMIYTLLRRVASLLGPETVISQRLLSPRGKAYTQQLPWAKVLMHLAAPGFVTVAIIWQLYLLRSPPVFLIPSAFIFVAFCAFHTRTRYRLSLLPSLGVWLAWLAGSPAASAGFDITSMVFAVTAGGLLFTLLLAGGRQEMERA